MRELGRELGRKLLWSSIMLNLLQLGVSSVPAGRAKSWNAKRSGFPVRSQNRLRTSSPQTRLVVKRRDALAAPIDPHGSGFQREPVHIHRKKARRATRFRALWRFNISASFHRRMKFLRHCETSSVKAMASFAAHLFRVVLIGRYAAWISAAQPSRLRRRVLARPPRRRPNGTSRCRRPGRATPSNGRPRRSPEQHRMESLNEFGFR